MLILLCIFILNCDIALNNKTHLINSNTIKHEIQSDRVKSCQRCQIVVLSQLSNRCCQLALIFNLRLYTLATLSTAGVFYLRIVHCTKYSNLFGFLVLTFAYKNVE